MKVKRNIYIHKGAKKERQELQSNRNTFFREILEMLMEFH